jgi:hypothetical protein
MTWHADNAIVDFDYAGDSPGCLFGFGGHGPLATRARKGHFAIGDRYRDAIGRHSNADVLGEAELIFASNSLFASAAFVSESSWDR